MNATTGVFGPIHVAHVPAPESAPVPLLTAVETLDECRSARARGDVDTTLRLSAAAQSLAADEEAWEVEFWAATAPGVMHMGRAEPGEAVGHFRNALDVALHRGLTSLLGSSYHNLYLAARDSESTSTVSARRYRAASFELYRDVNPRNPRIVALMADWAEDNFSRNRSAETASDALQHWRACPPSLPGPKERMLAACNMVVAAAWLGIRPRYRDGMFALDAALADLDDRECTSVALAHASTGAARMRDYARAVSLAETALRIAVARSEPVAEERAREVLDAALAERPVHV